jgi:hypothetical protein
MNSKNQKQSFNLNDQRYKNIILDIVKNTTLFGIEYLLFEEHYNLLPAVPPGKQDSRWYNWFYNFKSNAGLNETESTFSDLEEFDLFCYFFSGKTYRGKSIYNRWASLRYDREVYDYDIKESNVPPRSLGEYISLINKEITSPSSVINLHEEFTNLLMMDDIFETKRSVFYENSVVNSAFKRLKYEPDINFIKSFRIDLLYILSKENFFQTGVSSFAFRMPNNCYCICRVMRNNWPSKALVYYYNKTQKSLFDNDLHGFYFASKGFGIDVTFVNGVLK